MKQYDDVLLVRFI